MTSEELIQKVRKIEIKARGLSKNIFAGEYHSQFKGRGMAFAEVREYQPGDDVRSIDWNVTARLNHPYIKVFEEEREMTVMLLVDVSGSRQFGTLTQTKRDMMTEVAATLAFSTIENNDKVGVILFSDRVEKFIPPKKGKTHVLHIIRELLGYEPEHSETDIQQAIQYFANAQKRRCTAFVISDFQDEGFLRPASLSATRQTDMEKAWMIASSKHNLHAIRIYDKRDAELPNVGLLKLKDAETGERIWVDTCSKNVREEYAKSWRQLTGALQALLTKTNTPNVEVRTDEDYVRALQMLFKA